MKFSLSRYYKPSDYEWSYLDFILGPLYQLQINFLATRTVPTKVARPLLCHPAALTFQRTFQKSEHGPYLSQEESSHPTNTHTLNTVTRHTGIVNYFTLMDAKGNVIVEN